MVQINFTHRPFTHRHFYTQELLNTEAFTHRSFYTQTLLHTDHFTHRRFYTHKLLHTDAFTHRRFYTQTLLHTDPSTHTLTHRRFYTQKLLHTEAFTHFSGQLANRNFTSVFGDRTSFRAKGLRRLNPEIAILHQFFAIEPHFV